MSVRILGLLIYSLQFSDLKILIEKGVIPVNIWISCTHFFFLFFYKKLFYKKVSLIFAEKLRNPYEIFEAQM